MCIVDALGALVMSSRTIEEIDKNLKTMNQMTKDMETVAGKKPGRPWWPKPTLWSPDYQRATFCAMMAVISDRDIREMDNGQ